MFLLLLFVFYSRSDKPKQEKCNKCVVGSYNNEPGSPGCFICSPGKYGSSISDTTTKSKDVSKDASKGEDEKSCVDCPIGYYRGEDDALDTCIICRLGETTKLGARECSKCSAGKFASSPGMCQTCPIGFTQKDKGMEKCIECTKGKKTPMESSLPCGLCESGQFGGVAGFCTDCPGGWYEDEPGRPQCKACEKDTFLEISGAKSKGDCAKCSFSFAPLTTTGGVTGVSNASTGCVCAGANPSDKSINPDGYYTVKDDKFRLLMEERNPADRSVCVDCPSGANCEEDGTTVMMLSAKPGFWRSSSESKIFADCSKGYSSPNRFVLAKDRCCPRDPITNVSVCKEIFAEDAKETNKDTTRTEKRRCKIGYRGPLCRACDTDLSYVPIKDGCEHCEGGPSFFLALSTVASFCFFLGLAMCVGLRCLGK